MKNNKDRRTRACINCKERISAGNLPEVMKDIQRDQDRVSSSRQASHDFLYNAGIVTTKGELKRVYR